MADTLSSLLNAASSIELQVAAIYDLLAARFRAEVTLAQFWSLFAEAERYHSLLIQMQKLAVTQVTGDADRMAAWARDIDETRAWLDGILDRLSGGGWVPSVHEAFELAQEVESRSLEIQSRSFALY